MAPSLLHLHIPRTAGSSIHRTLNPYGLDNGGTISENSFAKITEQLRYRETPPGLITGHYHYGLHSYVKDSVYFSVLRDPVERVLSLISFTCATPVHKKHTLFRELDGDPVAIYDIVKDSVQLGNHQVGMLAGVQTENIGRAEYDLALAALENDNFVFTIQSRLAEGVDRLSEKLRYSFARPAVTNSAERLPVSHKGVEVIEKYNQWDRRLFDYCSAKLERGFV